MLLHIAIIIFHCCVIVYYMNNHNFIYPFSPLLIDVYPVLAVMNEVTRNIL